MKKATTVWLLLPFCLFVCCNEEGNDSKAIVAFLFFFVVTKKGIAAKLSSPFVLVLLQQKR
jgi:hypothetical protein